MSYQPDLECSGVSGPIAERWAFLEDEPDACAVVSRRMEVLYLNGPARPLVAPEWSGRRCWDCFPVGEVSCASRCPAVRAVHRASEIVYCEESLRPGGELLTLGVAVIPFDRSYKYGEQAVLLMRPKPSTTEDRLFRDECLSEAWALGARVEEKMGRGA